LVKPAVTHAPETTDRSGLAEAACPVVCTFDADWSLFVKLLSLR
jgi:hypothetical protein